MTTAGENRTYQIQPGERVTSVMAYTANLLVWGEVVTKEAIRVSTWLRTPSIPQFMFIHDARTVMFGGNSAPKPQAYQELHLPTNQIIAFHIRPPAHDPLDYEANEQMRKMEPTTALVGWFRFDGLIRMSTHTNLDRFLDASKETFATLYEVDVTQPAFPSMAPIHVPYIILRPDKVIFSPRTT